jgi:hypothetical protein
MKEMMLTLIINGRIRMNVPIVDVVEFVKATIITSLELRSPNVIDMTDMDELYNYKLSFSQGSRVLNCDIYKLSTFGGNLHFTSSIKREGYTLYDGQYILTEAIVYIPGPCSPIKGVFTRVIQQADLTRIYHIMIYGDFRLSCWQTDMLHIEFNGMDIYEELSRAHPLLKFELPLVNKYSYFIIVPETLKYM